LQPSHQSVSSSSSQSIKKAILQPTNIEINYSKKAAQYALEIIITLFILSAKLSFILFPFYAFCKIDNNSSQFKYILVSL
jgi:hypothetical protein